MIDPGPDGSATTVVVAEDNALLRDGLISMLQRFSFVVLAAVGTAEDLITAVSRCRPELVLTDVRMPPGFRDEGLRAAIRLRHDHPKLAIALLSQYVEHTYAAQLLASGGSGVGYLLKDRVSDVRALVDALREILAGGTVIDPEVVRRLLVRRHSPLERLTERERQTLALMAQSRANAAIAADLVVSEATVAKHIRSLFDKLDLPPDNTGHRRVLAVLTFLDAN